MIFVLGWLFGGAHHWRGDDGEEEMDERDWMERGGQQARAMLNGLDPFLANPDEDGYPTGGCYNGDYPPAWHDECNRRLDKEEYYEAENEAKLREIARLQQEQ